MRVGHHADRERRQQCPHHPALNGAQSGRDDAYGIHHDADDELCATANQRLRQYASVPRRDELRRQRKVQDRDFGLSRLVSSPSAKRLRGLSFAGSRILSGDRPSGRTACYAR